MLWVEMILPYPWDGEWPMHAVMEDSHLWPRASAAHSGEITVQFSAWPFPALRGPGCGPTHGPFASGLR